jgi:hypothetical protein
LVPSTVTVKPPGVLATVNDSALTLLAASAANNVANVNAKPTRFIFIVNSTFLVI